MSVVLLDPRFPAMIPVDAVALLSGDVSYTEEVPVRVRWVIADLGGHVVEESDILVTTDPHNEDVLMRLDEGAKLVAAPSLLVQMSGDREIEAGGMKALGSLQELEAYTPGSDAANEAESRRQEELLQHHAPEARLQGQDVSGGGVVDGEIVGTDEHTAAVAGMRRTSRTEVPSSVIDEVEDAIALMARALRQGEWEQSMTHTSLMAYLQEESEELGRIIDLMKQLVNRGEEIPRWMEQELCQELSDVLLQVLFHAEIANRRGSFDIGHVAGAFVAKMRSRAPYFFEDVERAVSKDEQDRLWGEAKKRETREKIESIGPDYEEFLAAKSASASSKASQPTQAEPSRTPADEVQPEPASDQQSTHNGSAPQSPMSGLAAAEAVIREARHAGLNDSQIPTEIRYPMVGLELDKPGQADQRLMDAVIKFQQSLRSQG